MLLLHDPSSLQHPYVYGVLVFEAMATFIGQVSVLSLIALFGAATTAMVRYSSPNSRFLSLFPLHFMMQILVMNVEFFLTSPRTL